jgi:DNA-binding SARP family transcriptional activator
MIFAHFVVSFARQCHNIPVMKSLRVYLSGPIAVEVDGRVVVREKNFRGKQGRLAFVYLVCLRTRSVSRDEIAYLIWSDQAAPSWEISLSAIISRLKALFAISAIADSEAQLKTDTTQCQLYLPAGAWVDLEACFAAIDNAESLLRSGKANDVLGPATIAASIARRPFLPGIDNEWLESQRRKLRRTLLRALDALSLMWLSSREPGLAIETATEAITIDNLRESSYRHLIEAYARTGNRPKAIEAYNLLRSSLAQELSAQPSHQTDSLFKKLISQY